MTRASIAALPRARRPGMSPRAVTSRRYGLTVAAICGFILAALLAGTARGQTTRTALDDYVDAPDPAYSWTLRGTTAATGYTIYRLELTSQAWMSSPGVNPSTWKHWVSIYKPNITTHDTALMLINGGVSSSGPDTSVDANPGLM
ncbi:MAG: PhoPQ-activated protein PqaA family protein, partial [Pirellulales bacterium]